MSPLGAGGARDERRLQVFVDYQDVANNEQSRRKFMPIASVGNGCPMGPRWASIGRLPIATRRP
jgi:hypothetical protein